MAKSTVNLKPLEAFADKLRKQQDDVAVKNASYYAANKIRAAWETSGYQIRTGNLDDSFLWIVCYGGQVKNYGFLFDSEKSSKHIKRNGVEYVGRREAEKFIANYIPTTDGIEIVFASAMFYAGYLEEGTQRGVFRVLRGIKADLENDFGMQNITTNIFPV